MKKETMKYEINENKGITLIALIVTIIVLLILAGVSIAIVSREDGIIATTKKTRASTIVAQEVEKIKLAYSSASMSSKNGKASSAELRKELKSNKDNVTVTIAKSNTTDENGKRENGIKVIYNKTGNIYFVDKNGNIIKDGSYIKDVSAVYWLVYSNNSDDSDLELVFNSTGNVDSNSKLIEKGGDISKTLFATINDVPYYKYAEKIKQATIEDEITSLYTPS